jgi:hypothetical protein
MTKALVIQQDSLKLAIDSAVNTAKAINDFMYGTKDRANVTSAFAIALLGLAMYLQSAQPAYVNFCS